MNRIKLTKRSLCRIGALLLVAVMLLPVLCACDGGNGTQTPTSEGTSDTTVGVTLNGVPIEQYEIRFAWRDSNKENDAAKEIREAIKTAFGVSLKVFEDTDTAGEHLIMVGDRDGGEVTSSAMDLTETDYALTRDDNSVYVLAKSVYGMQQAAKELCDRITASAESKTLLIGKGAVQSYAEKIVNSMTFNIRNWSPSDAHLARISVTIKNANYPDTIGFQEFGKPRPDWDWAEKLMAREDISSIYAMVGEDRGDGTGERAAIFYRKDKYRLIESGTKWLYGSDPLGSDTPGRVRVEHVSSHGDYYRVYSYVLLERISDGVRVAHINTHLDTVSYYSTTETGLEVQTQQLSYAIAMAKKLHEENNCTVVFTGDFNAKPTFDSFKSITAAGFSWTEQIAKKRVGSQVDDKYLEENLTICKDIDHIFLLDDNPYCLTYTICNKKISYRTDGEDYASDHLARYATYIVD